MASNKTLERHAPDCTICAAHGRERGHFPSLEDQQRLKLSRFQVIVLRHADQSPKGRIAVYGAGSSWRLPATMALVAKNLGAVTNEEGGRRFTLNAAGWKVMGRGVDGAPDAEAREIDPTCPPVAIGQSWAWLGTSLFTRYRLRELDLLEEQGEYEVVELSNNLGTKLAKMRRKRDGAEGWVMTIGKDGAPLMKKAQQQNPGAVPEMWRYLGSKEPYR